MKSATRTQHTLSATEARAHFGQVIQNACEGNEHVIVERDGIPVIAMLPISEHHRLIKIGHFERLAYTFGSKAEAWNLTEEALAEEMEAIKRETFEERYEGSKSIIKLTHQNRGEEHGENGFSPIS